MRSAGHGNAGMSFSRGGGCDGAILSSSETPSCRHRPHSVISGRRNTTKSSVAVYAGLTRDEVMIMVLIIVAIVTICCAFTLFSCFLGHKVSHVTYIISFKSSQ